MSMRTDLPAGFVSTVEEQTGPLSGRQWDLAVCVLVWELVRSGIITPTMLAKTVQVIRGVFAADAERQERMPPP